MRKMEITESFERELTRWPNVTFRYEPRGRHKSLILQYGTKNRFVIFSDTPTNRRAVLNNVSTMKKVLAGLGAVRQ